MRTKNRILACAAVLVSIGCGSDKDAGKSLTLGAVVDQTGSAGPGTWAEAARLATSQMNEALNGAGSEIQFNLVVSDSTNVASVAAKRAQDLVTSEKAKGLVLDTSQDYVEVLKLQYDDDAAKHLDVPVVGMVASSPSVNNPAAANPDPLAQAAYRDADEWGFRSSMSSGPQGLVLAQIVQDGGDLNGDGLLKVSVFASNEPFGLGQVNAFASVLTAQVPDAIVEKILFNPADHTPNDLAFYADTLGQLVDGQTDGVNDGVPDFLLGLTFPDYLAAIIKAHKQAGSAIRFVHGMALRNQKILDSLGADANGQEGVSFVVVAPDQSGQNFARDMQSATSVPANSLDSATYDAAAVLMLASLIAGQGQSDPTAVTGQQVRDAMASTSDPAGTIVRPGVKGFASAVGLIQQGKPINYEGAQGPCDFDQYGNVNNDLIHFTIENSVFKDQELYDCVSDASCPKL
jgi:branched-chain amino acid transport system substrate-binding protein